MKLKQLSKKNFLAILFVLFSIKVVFCSFLYEHDSNDRLSFSGAKFKFTHQFFYGGDDCEVVNTTVYLRQTGKILADSPYHSFVKPRFRGPNPYLTAFRPKAIVYLQSFAIQLYEQFTGNKINIANSPYMNDYLNYYGMFIYCLTILLFALSVYCFYKTLLVLNISKAISQFATFAYILIPSVFIFIGHMDSWENVALSCEVCLFYYILSEWTLGNTAHNNSTISWFAPLFVLSALFRPHLLMTYAALCGFALLLFLYHKYVKKNRQFSWLHIRTALIGFLLLIVAHIPILIQNKQYFGAYFLSTQSKFEFFQGHNPFARSSWNPNLYTHNQAYFDSIFNAKKITTLNEYEEAQLYSEMSMDWIKQHPIQEFILSLKKVAGYFIPYNHNNNRINLYTLFLECAFFVFSFELLKKLKYKKELPEIVIDTMLMLPVIMSISLTILCFVGYRWRYYAEPFFLIMAALILDRHWGHKTKDS